MSTISNRVSKYVLSLILFFSNQVLNSQDLIEKEIKNYLIEIEKLVDEEKNKQNFLIDGHHLLNDKSTPNNPDKVEVYHQLFKYYIYRATDSAKYFNDKALNLSKNISYSTGIYRAKYNQAYIFFIEGDFENSLEIIEAVEFSGTLSKKSDLQADFNTLKSYIYTERGDYETSLELCLNLLNQGKKEKNDHILKRGYSAISHLYLRIGEIKKSLDYCLRSLNLIIKYKEVEHLFPKIDEIARMTHVLKGSESAMQIYFFYLRMEEKVQGPGSYIQSVVYMNIADIYIEEERFEKAQDFLTKAMGLIDTNNYRFRKPRAYLLKAKLSTKIQDTVLAIDNYEKALKAAEKIAAFDVIKNASKSLEELYIAKEDSLKARYFSNLHNFVSDSLFSTETNQRIKILEAQQKISEISQQKKNLEIQNRFQKDRYRLTLLILAIALISAGISVYSFLKVKKKNKLLFHRTKELTFEKLNKNNDWVNKRSKKLNASIQSAVDDDTKKFILTRLRKREAKKFFLNSKCSLHILAEELQTNPKYLSQVINQEKKSNFNNYLNELRINHLLERLMEDVDFRNSKLSYIAACSGFNNTNTFNSAFKKRLGILPSYFIEKLNNEEK